MNLFAIIQPRGFGAAQMPIFETRSVYIKIVVNGEVSSIMMLYFTAVFAMFLFIACFAFVFEMGKVLRCGFNVFTKPFSMGSAPKLLFSMFASQVLKDPFHFLFIGGKGSAPFFAIIKVDVVDGKAGDFLDDGFEYSIADILVFNFAAIGSGLMD